MSDKIKVPKGMLTAASLSTVKNNDFGEGAMDEIRRYYKEWPGLEGVLKASLEWLAENPIVPTEEQAKALTKELDAPYPSLFSIWWPMAFKEWQRQIFLEPEPEVPEVIKDLMYTKHDISPPFERHNNLVIEAYNRGREAGIAEGNKAEHDFPQGMLTIGRNENDSIITDKERERLKGLMFSKSENLTQRAHNSEVVEGYRRGKEDGIEEGKKLRRPL
jgi:hypothetical protein